MGAGCMGTVSIDINRNVQTYQQQANVDQVIVKNEPSKQEESKDLCSLIYINNKKLSELRKPSSNQMIIHPKNQFQKSLKNMNYQTKNKSHTNAKSIHDESNRQKLEFMQLNRKFISQSIEASKSVQHILNILDSNQLLKSPSYNMTQKLKAKNLKGIIAKQNRYKNLQSKIRKIEPQKYQNKEQNLYKQHKTSSLYRLPCQNTKKYRHGTHRKSQIPAYKDNTNLY